ncbi:fluoride efflux transporter CrcB [Robertmurraya korlensis]|uniref:fluoride efflux transporter CrcB n=1 Tax=Robertmurraya korlensis TaxID=519977 RepID=UPI00203D7DA6|nr:fluoride efflux transporter CrcB [Robertmurraya korlensis]MCM3601554.1 fluoride efflux transporter CrcB [Robertmurraya korlensis]
MRLIFVGIGGSIGSVLRYSIYYNMLAINGDWLPFLGTLLANLLGAFALGWFTSRMLLSKKLPDDLAAAIGTGLIGSFTTFSTLSVELSSLLQEGQYLLAICYVCLSMVGGLVCAFGGFRIGQRRVVVQ